MKNYFHPPKLSLFCLTALLLLAVSCSHAPKDEEIQASVILRLQENPDFTNIKAAVKDGVLTLEGDCPSKNCDSLVTKQVKDVEGVKSIDNKIQFDYATDLTLRTSVQSIISKYEGVQADVAAGVVVLRGAIEKKQIEPLMNELKALKPKKLDNQLALK